MKKKKNRIVPIVALVCAMVALALSALCLVSIPEDQSHLIDDLYAQTASLQKQLDTMEEALAAAEDKLDRLMTSVNLKSWTLDTAPWEENTGADVTFSAIPSTYQPDLQAFLMVKLDGREIHLLPCQWDGTAFTSTVSVDAADGYSYFCQLTTPMGTQVLPLTGPGFSDPADCVYLASNMSAYCNLMVNGWTENADSGLILTDAYAQVQVPRISAAGPVELLSSELTLLHNGELTLRIPIQLSPSEVEGSLELMITNRNIPMPELEEGDTLELFLDIQFSDGRQLDAFGILWRMDQGRLSSAVG